MDHVDLILCPPGTFACGAGVQKIVSAGVHTVGIESGYYDQSHFIRHFWEYTTYTPRRFQEKRPALKSRLFLKT
ncbi:MAG: hypothetical protein SCK57_07605 [Bacillota bacterium]|nr:hypothetical protein [Bacillota bacterium]